MDFFIIPSERNLSNRDGNIDMIMIFIQYYVLNKRLYGKGLNYLYILIKFISIYR